MRIGCGIKEKQGSLFSALLQLVFIKSLRHAKYYSRHLGSSDEPDTPVPALKEPAFPGTP